jgi:hypothetical protein
MTEGEAYFVLPGYKNHRYIMIKTGSCFGIVDIHGSAQIESFDPLDFQKNKHLLKRQFSVQANGECETL